MAAHPACAPGSAAAVDTIQQAFEDFERTVTPNDSYTFSTTTLGNVRQAALDAERLLAARQSLCNVARLEPFFAGLEHYSKVIEILCNGTPYLPWIWAPVKLTLQLASEHIESFKIIIDAYAQIAETLPRFDRLGEAFKANPEFQQVLAVFYADILRFHKEAYIFLRRNGWSTFFRSSWGRFNRRFKGILANLSRHSELVDKEANAWDIAEAQKWRKETRLWREESLSEIAKREREQASAQYQSVLLWLEAKDSEQDDIFDTLSNSSYPGTCEWILKNSKIVSWLRQEQHEPFLWLMGKPGSGKSVMISRIIHFLQQDKQTIILYHFCTYVSSPSTRYGHILRSLVAKLLRGNSDLLAYVYEEYVLDRKTASPTNLEHLILTLLPSLSSERSKVAVRIILDGLDECEEDQQQRIISILDRASRLPTTGTVCKVLVSSRDTPKLTKLLRRKPSISFKDEIATVSKAIQYYVQKRLNDMKLELLELQITDSQIEYAKNTIVAKSDGMILWARLVLDMLSSEVFNFNDMKAAVDSLPKGLPEFYGRILSRLYAQLGSASLERARRTLSWIAFAKRPMKKFELQTVIDLHTENTVPTPLLPDQAFDLCKPLIEISSEGILRFVHLSVQEYLVDPTSGPFLRETIGCRDMSIACAVYLTNALRVLSPPFSEHDRNCLVGKGLHGFHLYAHEFWVEHLLGFAKIGGDTITGGSTPLSRLLHEFCNMIHPSNALDPTIMDGDARPSNWDARLALLAADNRIYAAVASELYSRSRTKDGARTPNPGRTPSTALTQALKTYQNTVQLLLDSESYPGLSRDELETFKTTYRTEAYTCRYSRCPRASNGFKSDQLRCQHENDVHRQSLKCTVPECKFGLSFASNRALKSHIQKYHSLPSTKNYPQSIRRLLPPSQGPKPPPSQNSGPNAPFGNITEGDGWGLDFGPLDGPDVQESPAALVPQFVLPHVHLVSSYRFPHLATLQPPTAFDYLLNAPKIVNDAASVAWMYFQAPPQDGTVLLTWQPPVIQSKFASDGYIWADPEATYTIEIKGYTLEILVHRSGYRFGFEQIAIHSRHRYRITSKAPGANMQHDPSLWIVHYAQAEPNNRFPANQIQVPQEVQRIMKERSYLEKQGKLLRKEFMLRDRGNWPGIKFSGGGPMLGSSAPQQEGMPMNKDSCSDAKPTSTSTKHLETFLKNVLALMQQMGQPFNPQPLIGMRPVNLLQLYSGVMKQKGSKRVTAAGAWPTTAHMMGFPQQNFPTAGEEMRIIFEQNLGPYEAAYFAKMQSKFMGPRY